MQITNQYYLKFQLVWVLREQKVTVEFTKGGTVNTFGNENNSVSFFTIHLDKSENSVVCIETNTTYFKPTEQINKINSLVSFESPMLLNDVLTYLTK